MPYLHLAIPIGSPLSRGLNRPDGHASLEFSRTQSAQ
jgi:hypothetical protein